MKRHTQESKSQFIPLSKLKSSPRNARKTPHTKAHINALADSIEAHGQIQNLVAGTELDTDGNPTGCYLVTAGEGRRLAQLLRVKRKKIKADEPIRCLVDDTHSAEAISLAENELRANMHPADQFIAFKGLVDSGQSIEDVAAHFGITPLVVQRRLKLANVGPEFLALYRKEAVNLDQLMALALSDDHDKQKAVWESLPKNGRDAESLRRALTENEIAIDEAIVKFVGTKAYEKAGGAIRRDLFAESQDEGFIVDVELLQRLATEKLEKAAAQLKEDGHAWVEVIPRLDYSTLSAYRHVRSTAREPNKKEQAKLDKLQAARDDVEKQAADAGEDEDRLTQLDDRTSEIDVEIESLQDALRVPDPEQQSLAGAIVSISHSGELRIEEGLLKPDDAKRFARSAKAVAKEISLGGPRIHSAALVRRLTAHRTLALQAELVQQPMTAAIALTHRLLLDTFYVDSTGRLSSVEVTMRKAALGDHIGRLEDCQAFSTLDAHRRSIEERLPKDAEALLPWLLQQSGGELLSFLAYCVSVTVDGVHSDEGPSALDGLVQAAKLDMRRWWTPTVEGYLGSVPKQRILEIVREATSPEVAATLTSLKKKPLAEAAERKLAGTGWLPSTFRSHTA